MAYDKYVANGNHLIVHKFGGTSVGDAQRISNVANIILSQHEKTKAIQSAPQRGQPPLQGSAVVVSAMTGVTDQLITGGRAAAEGKDSVYREIKSRLLQRHLEVVETLLSHSPERLEVGGLIEDRLHDLERLYRSIAVLGEFTVRGCDAVSSLGEQLSANILAAVLRERGERAQAVPATELIVTDESFGAAQPLKEPTDQRINQRLRPLIERGVIPVVTGYIAATEQGVTTTLGRGGSDYTAAILGAGLGAEEVWIWSDVDGILTADPNLVPEARTLRELSYTEAASLAYYGADVLHPKTIRPVIEAEIPLRILNSFNPTHPGTLIVKTPDPKRDLWPAIISTTGLSLIAVGTRDDHWTQLEAARALQLLSEAGVEVPLFSQSFSEHSLNLVVREQNHAHCLNVLRREFGGEHTWAKPDATETTLPERPHTNGTYNLGVKEKVATVSVVGFPGWHSSGIVSLAFTALGKCGTRVIAVAQAGTEYSVSFCIPEDQVESTVRILHGELGPEETHV
jgi:bifunctional aspartokinase / homoserine dehydrogenase 1